MDKIEEFRTNIKACDEIMIEQLAVRMSNIREMMKYKKENNIPFLQSEQEEEQCNMLISKLCDHEFEEETVAIFKEIMKNGRRIMAKNLFDFFVAARTLKTSLDDHLSRLLHSSEN